MNGNSQIYDKEVNNEFLKIYVTLQGIKNSILICSRIT